MPTLQQAKAALNKVISIGRVHLYKPIQIAEVLYRARTRGDLTPSRLETYRKESKAWRDAVSIRLLGRVSTSSAKYQDDVFNASAMPPVLLDLLSQENIRTGGAIEKYIYDSFAERYNLITGLIGQLDKATPKTFNLTDFIGNFLITPGLRRSVDKAYEIVVYALFDTIVSNIGATITIKSDQAKSEILKEFEDFTRLVLGIDPKNIEITLPARLYRVGVTNAADRGLDIWANFGPAVQVKHLSFSDDMAENVTGQLTADQIVIVCQNAEAAGVRRILEQLGLANRVRGVITERNLIDWYEKCLRGKFSASMGPVLLESLRREFACEFPAATQEFQTFYKERGYDKMPAAG